MILLVKKKNLLFFLKTGLSLLFLGVEGRCGEGVLPLHGAGDLGSYYHKQNLLNFVISPLERREGSRLVHN